LFPNNHSALAQQLSLLAQGPELLIASQMHWHLQTLLHSRQQLPSWLP
jgi:hypothetical protein